MSDKPPTNEELLSELSRCRLNVRLAANGIMPEPGKAATRAVEDAFKFFCKYANLIEQNALAAQKAQNA